MLSAEVAILPTSTWANFLCPNRNLACGCSKCQKEEIMVVGVQVIDIFRGGELARVGSRGRGSR